MAERFVLCQTDNRDRVIVTTDPVSFDDNPCCGIQYQTRDTAYAASAYFRSKGFRVFARPLTEEDVAKSIECVGGLKLLPVPASTSLCTDAVGSVVSDRPALPGSSGAPPASETPTVVVTPVIGDVVTPPTQAGATTNTLCTLRASREAVTQAFIKVMGLEGSTTR